MPATAKIRSNVIIHPKGWNSLLFMNDPFPVLLGTDSRTGKYKFNVLDRIAAQPKLKARYHSPSPAFTKLPTSAEFTPSQDRKTFEKPARSPAGVPADPIRHTNGDLHKTLFPESTRTCGGGRKGINSGLPLRLR